MKLGDILPHWIFRERAGIDAEIGGGSAFAHLTEDAGSSQIVADWNIILGDQGAGPQISLGQDGQLGLYMLDAESDGFEAIYMAKWSDTNARFSLRGDGSLHWGNGTGAPDVSLVRDPNAGRLRIPEATARLELGPDNSAAYLQLSTNEMFVQAANGTDYVDVGAEGAYIELHRNGHTVTLTVDGAGDLTVNGAKVTHA